MRKPNGDHKTLWELNKNFLMSYGILYVIFTLKMYINGIENNFFIHSINYNTKKLSTMKQYGLLSQYFFAR